MLQEWPDITCIIPAANEESTIRSKIENLLKAYPADRMRIIVVLNNSTDSTGDICKDLDVTVIESAPGKRNALEAGRLAAETECVLATDCDVRLNTDTVKRLVSNLVQSPDNVCAVSAFCGYTFDRSTRLGSTMNAHEFKQARLCQLQGELASSALIQGTCYVYRKSTFPAYPLDAAEDELSMAIEIVRAGYRAETDVKAQCHQYCPVNFRHIFLMLTRHAGRQIHTCLKNLDIIFRARTKMYGRFIFPFYVLLPRCLPFITIFILSIPFQTGISAAIFYSVGITIYIIIALLNPFFALQIAALHFGWIYVLICRKKGSVWHSGTCRK